MPFLFARGRVSLAEMQRQLPAHGVERRVRSPDLVAAQHPGQREIEFAARHVLGPLCEYGEWCTACAG